MKSLLTIFSILFCLNSFSQDCAYDFVQNSSLLKNQKVKKVNVYGVNKTTGKKDLFYEYYIHSNGAVFKFVRYSQNGKEIQSQTECSCSSDSLIKTNSVFIHLGSDKKIFSRKILEYNTKEELISQSIETFDVNYQRYISRYNPSNLKESNIEMIVMQNNDTIRHSKSLKNIEYEEVISKEKIAAKWEVRKEIMHIVPSSYFTYELYKNGELITSKKTMYDSTNSIIINDENNNVLPYIKNKNTTDTLTNPAKEMHEQSRKHINKKMGSKNFKTVIHYLSDTKKDAFLDDTYYSNGLVFISSALQFDYFLLFEYEFY